MTECVSTTEDYGLLVADVAFVANYVVEFALGESGVYCEEEIWGCTVEFVEQEDSAVLENVDEGSWTPLPRSVGFGEDTPEKVGFADSFA